MLSVLKVEKLRGSKMKGHEKFIFLMFKMEMLLITNVFNCKLRQVHYSGQNKNNFNLLI